MSQAAQDLDSPSPLSFISQELVSYENEAMFSFDLPRHGSTWALRIFPQLVCVESLVQAARRFLQAPGASFELEAVRFTGAPRPGDTLVLKLRRADPDGQSRQLSGEVWVHHRMVAQAQLFTTQNLG